MFHGQVEGTGFEVLDPRFEDCLIGHARVERLWTGARWSEGPAWFAAGRYLIWSDIPNNRMLRHDDCSGHVSVFRAPSNNSNGNAVDREGRLVTCEHLTRRVTRTDHDGSIIVLSDNYQGKRLNSPNDVVVKSDGSIWFTDPPYGILFDYEGRRAESEIGRSNVYRIDPSTGHTEIVADDFEKPNGLAFSPDEKFLYVADTGVTHKKNGPKHIRRCELKQSGLGQSMIFADCTAGLFDGFRIDEAGRLWTSAADGVIATIWTVR
jgi:gluconolactonase